MGVRLEFDTNRNKRDRSLRLICEEFLRAKTRKKTARTVFTNVVDER